MIRFLWIYYSSHQVWYFFQTKNPCVNICVSFFCSQALDFDIFNKKVKKCTFRKNEKKNQLSWWLLGSINSCKAFIIFGWDSDDGKKLFETCELAWGVDNAGWLQIGTDLFYIFNTFKPIFILPTSFEIIIFQCFDTEKQCSQNKQNVNTEERVYIYTTFLKHFIVNIGNTSDIGTNASVNDGNPS